MNESSRSQPTAGASGSDRGDRSPEDNNYDHNDCSKMCSIPIGGARPKVKQHFCNIGNPDSGKLNNNGSIQNGMSEAAKPRTVQNGASTSSTSSSDTSPCENYMRNNVDCHNIVDKCPSKVRDSGGKQNTRERWSFDGEESSSGNEADDGLSGDDCCIYTYKGDQFADLPSSFFTLDRIANGLEQPGEPEPQREAPPEENDRSIAGSSPEMDFLEMDFDPGPSLEQDSEEEFDSYDRKLKSDNDVSPVPELPSEPEAEVENDLSGNRDNEMVNVSVRLENDLGISSAAARDVRTPVSPDPQPGPSRLAATSPHTTNHQIERTCWPARDSWGHHCSSGDLCSPGDPTEMEPGETLALWNAGNMRIQGEMSPDTRKYNLHSALYHCIMAKRLVMDKKGSLTEGATSCVAVVKGVSRDSKPPLDRTMIWSEQEACTKQVTQISTSACGATAVINVMLALNTPFSLERVKEGVATRLRAESAAVPQYLFSRSQAGATHENLMRGLELASEGSIFSRFFHMYPEREFSLSRWLSYWMKKGAVAIATLNLQYGVAPENPIPDAWHHQMVFGVSPRGIYLTNPLECVHEASLLTQLSSPSVLRVKRSDVLSRWNSNTDLRPLSCHPDVRWKKMNVLGQVVNIVRESSCGGVQCRPAAQHITIPASYKAGITLSLPRESPGYEELLTAPELPLLCCTQPLPD